MKQKFVRYYMNLAQQTALLSYAKRLQVGAVIVKGNQIIATGYNGTPSGWDNVCETRDWCQGGGWLDVEYIETNWPYEGTYYNSQGQEFSGRYKLKTKPEVLHAEMNCLTKVARSTMSSEGSSLFCTHAPCLECAKAIYQSGVVEVYYEHEYRSLDGVEFLKRCDIPVIKFSTEEVDK